MKKVFNIYWVLQIVGWLLWAFNETLVYTQNFGWKIEWIFSAMINITLGIFFTHSYRNIYNRYNWQEFPLKKSIPLEIISLGLMSFLLTAINLPIDAFILQENYNLTITAFGILQIIFDFMKPIAIWQLIYFIYRYSNKKIEMLNKNQNLEMTIRATEGKMLRTQMNPHFVFNSLNSIRGLIHEDPKKAETSITQLSKLLRNSLLADRNNLVSLKEEMETVLDYLSLEKIRYEDRLDWIIHFPNELKNIQIPPMIIQTLVENAIKHGISKSIKGGLIEIKIEKEAELMVIKVINPGSIHLDSSNENGFGTEITQKRLALIFGDTAQLRLEPLDQNKVLASLKFNYFS